MSGANEMVAVELSGKKRLQLDCAICRQIRSIEYASGERLDLGFELPALCPVGKGAEITFSQLVVLARTLKMRITIRELEMRPL